MIYSLQTARATARPNKDVIAPLQPYDRPAKVAVSIPADTWFCPDSGAGRGEDGHHEKTHCQQARQADAAARTRGFLGNRRPAAAKTARPQPTGVLDHRQS